jgi:putative tricarboxylic transport membrane protein
MVDAALSGLFQVLAWPAIGYLLVGVAAGMYFGAVPGLSGLVGMAILLPFTFDVDPVPAFALLLGMFAVTTTSDTISAVLIGVPGTAGSQATVLDGYPMAKKGEAARAFGAAFTCSAIGGVLSALLLGLSIPVVRPIVLSFASPEFFMLGILGLTMVGTLSGTSILKGLAAACLGILIATIGYSPVTGVPRFAFGIPYLLDDGLPIIPLAVGLFGIPEVIFLATRYASISQVDPGDVQHGMWQGVKDVFRHWWIVLRCSVIGMWIGVLPGIGASIADWVAYGHVVQTSRDRENFGKGDIRGVIAPESANNATKGASLIPMIAFGIPGSAGVAVLLGAFLIQGIAPGPTMLTDKLDLTFSMMWSLVIANLVGSGFLMMWSRQLAKLVFVRSALIVPAIVLFLYMGAWMSGTSMGDWAVLLLTGFLGLAMIYAGWPRAPLILGFVLGTIMENALGITLQRYTWDWALRPASAILMAFTIIALISSVVSYWRRRGDSTGTPRSLENMGAEEGGPPENFASLPFAVFALAIFAFAIFEASHWRADGSRMVNVFAYPGLVFCLVMIAADARFLVRNAGGGVGAILRQYGEILRASKEPLAILKMLGWFLGIVAATYLVGQIIALPLFTFLYLKVRELESWTISLGYAAAAWLLLWGMFDQLIHVFWQPPLLSFLRF